MSKDCCSNSPDKDKQPTSTKTQDIPKDWTAYWPLGLALALVFFITLGASVLTHKSSAFFLMKYLMATFFSVFAGLKFMAYRNFPATFSTYDPIAAKWPVYGWIYPWIELGWAFAYWLTCNLTLVNWSVIVLLMATTFGIAKQLRQGKKGLRCACVGTFFQLPLGKVTILENLAMILMALWMNLRIMSL